MRMTTLFLTIPLVCFTLFSNHCESASEEEGLIEGVRGHETTRHFRAVGSRFTFYQGRSASKLRFPGTVIWVEGNWTSQFHPHRTFVYKVTASTNTVVIFHQVFSNFFFGDILSGTVKVGYLSESPQIRTDVNKDNVVNFQDLVFVASRFGQSDGSVDIGSRTFTWKLNDADVNWDGIVNISDLVLVAGMLSEDAAAPSIHPQLLALLSDVEVQYWLEEARRISPSDAISQRGVTVLEQMLSALMPEETVLLVNYPNPFNPETWIPYHLSTPAEVTLRIYTTDGKLVRSLALGHQPAGIYECKSRAAYWDGRNRIGERVASGLYFYTLTAGDFAATRKMLIMK